MSDVEDQPFTKLELESVKPLPVAEGITSLSQDGLRKHYGKYIVKLSDRRVGMKLKHALAIADGTLPRSS